MQTTPHPQAPIRSRQACQASARPVPEKFRPQHRFRFGNRPRNRGCGHTGSAHQATECPGEQNRQGGKMKTACTYHRMEGSTVQLLFSGLEASVGYDPAEKTHTDVSHPAMGVPDVNQAASFCSLCPAISTACFSNRGPNRRSYPCPPRNNSSRPRTYLNCRNLQWLHNGWRRSQYAG